MISPTTVIVKYEGAKIMLVCGAHTVNDMIDLFEQAMRGAGYGIGHLIDEDDEEMKEPK